MAEPAQAAFPSGFLWGAATASFQIEGGREDRGDCIWDTFSHTPGKVMNNDHGDVACDHYHKLEEDVQMMKDMGLKAYRFSISWPRLWPDGTRASESAKGVAFYTKLLELLEAAGIAACATLYHWDLPSATYDKGGMLVPEFVGWFDDYATRCFELFDARVSMWITFNEPWCICALGYCSGAHAPGRNRDPGREPYTAAHHLLLAHAKAYRTYKRLGYKKPIGITLCVDWNEPATHDPRDVAASIRSMDFTLGWFAEPVFLTGDYPQVMRDSVSGGRLPTFTDAQQQELRGSSDFFGLNWYSARLCAQMRVWRTLRALPSLLRMAAGEPNGITGNIQSFVLDSKDGPGNYFGDIGVVISQRTRWQRTAMGWPVTAWGLARMLVYIQRKYGKGTYTPWGGIYITENGVAVPGDEDVVAACDPRPGQPGAKRTAYVRSHLYAVQQATQKGADVRGFFLWSLMDNFEWAFGYGRRFGAVHVDYKTLKRTPKAVVPFYRDVIAHNAVTPGAREAATDLFGPESGGALSGLAYGPAPLLVPGTEGW